MTTAAENSKPEADLPDIREDLRFLGRVANVSGQDAWLIFDPLQHRYFRIDGPTFQLLTVWNRCAGFTDLASAVRDDFGLLLDEDFLSGVMRFLQSENLLVEPAGGNWRNFEARRVGRQQSWGQWLVHNYLYIRIPLIRPSSFLKSTLPMVAPFFTRSAVLAVFILGITSLYLVSRQWDAFINSFSDFYSFEGILIYGVVLIGIKIFHELGHAYTATRYGCRIPTIGVAFLVMFPVLYTDVTDAWRLRSRRQRLLIAAAGMIVEIMIASLATFIWVFMPEGTAKSVAFVTATLSWVLSFAVNLNPFMRFDGYYLLSDFLGVENLQSRSFAFGRWKLREYLFDLKIEPPEPMPARLRTVLVAYAWGTWIYRLILFIGIAVLVYVFFFKVLGVLLFAIEIGWFIAKPVWSELKVWWNMRRSILTHLRSYVSGYIILSLIVLAALPISASIQFPAIMEASRFERLFAPDSARLEQIIATEGRIVQEGDILFVFISPDLEQKIELTESRKRIVAERLRRITSSAADRANFRVNKRQLEALQEHLEGLQRESRRLVVKADFSGQIVDVDTGLHVGQWVNSERPLATLRRQQGVVVRGYATEDKVARLGPGSTGYFLPEDYNRQPVNVSLARISDANVSTINLPYLSSINGFGVAVRKRPDGLLAPVEPQYELRLSADKPMQEQVIRGYVHLSARRESLATRIWRQALGVIVRETGV